MNINEKLLLLHPNVTPYYYIKYELYKLLNIDFDLFFIEDIINYKNDFYGVAANDYNHNYMTSHLNVLVKKYNNNCIPISYDINSEYWCINKYDKNIYSIHIIAIPSPNGIYNNLWRINYNMYYFMSRTIFSTKEFSDEQIKIINKIIAIQRKIGYTNLSNTFKQLMETYHG